MLTTINFNFLTKKLPSHLNFHPNLFVRSILHSLSSISPILIINESYSIFTFNTQFERNEKSRGQGFNNLRFLPRINRSSISIWMCHATVHKRDSRVYREGFRVLSRVQMKRPVDQWHRHVAADRRKRPWFHVATLSFPVRGRGRIKRALDRDSLARGRRRSDKRCANYNVARSTRGALDFIRFAARIGSFVVAIEGERFQCLF